ncbi:MAG: hypothetical protein SA339_05370 [Methanomassiliicoccus sp.]|nr:hypothetical protein [Methanomassiliicoccus sp.]
MNDKHSEECCGIVIDIMIIEGLANRSFSQVPAMIERAVLLTDNSYNYYGLFFADGGFIPLSGRDAQARSQVISGVILSISQFNVGEHIINAIISLLGRVVIPQTEG